MIEASPDAPTVAPLRAEERDAKAQAFAAELEPGDPSAPAGTPAAKAVDLGPEKVKETLEQAFRVCDGILAKRLQGWEPLSPQEVSMLAEGWTPIAILYAPALLASPWASAALTTAVVLGPRVLTLAERARQPASSEPAP